MSNENIILIGFMGSGKTSAGSQLSRQTGYRFIDLDREIEAGSGKTIPRIFTYGESYFRTLEAEAIRRVCKVRQAVISTGGGAVKLPGNREILRQSGLVFYLKWPAEDLYEHVKGNTSRPLLNVPDPFGELESLLKEREPLYLSTAHVVVECAGKQIKAIADEIEGYMEIYKGAGL